MINTNINFGESSSSSGISSLGLNLKSFIFQLVTFLIVLLIMRRWVFPRLVATLEQRRQTLERSLQQAQQTEETLREAETKAAQTLQKARVQADKALADAKTQAKDIAARAEQSAEESAARIVSEAQAQLQQEREKLHSEIKGEVVDLVTLTTEKVIRKSLSAEEDIALIKSRIKELQE